MRHFYVYIMANPHRHIHTGFTNNLERRVFEHKNKLVEGFTAKYNMTRLVYFEYTEDARAGISREKELKGWLRSKKVALIEAANLNWEDLSLAWVLPGSANSKRLENT